MTMQSLQDLLTHELQDLYSAEQQLLQVLPALADAANSPQLKTNLEDEIWKTRDQAKLLEEVCEQLAIVPTGKACKGMQGLIAEGKEVLKDNNKPSMVRDAALIAAAQRVEHYEIAGYGCAATYAKQLGKTDLAEKLASVLEQEKHTDETLTRLAKECINKEAAN